MHPGDHLGLTPTTHPFSMVQPPTPQLLEGALLSLAEPSLRPSAPSHSSGWQTPCLPAGLLHNVTSSGKPSWIPRPPSHPLFF